MENKEHLCELAAKKESFEKLKAAARNAKYICPGCGRVAADKERICCRAEELYGEGKAPKDRDCCE